MQADRPEAALLAALESAWTPQPGRQAEAYHSEADVLLYGGAAGGGKSDLLLGLAHTRHQRSIVFRREFAMLGALEDRARELLAGKGSWNGQDHRWRLDDGRVIEFGAVQLPGDVVKYQGRPHDFIGFDEITHFTEEQFRFLIGWLRSPDPAQRKRVVAAGNPPTSAEGDWVIRYWAPWLDNNHPNPAKPGELRWFATIDGKDVEVESGAPFEHDGELIEPMSRTFIPASLDDNPILAQTGYRRTLQNLPEPLRSQLLFGDFSIAQEDDTWQVIPTAWVIAAQARWTPEAPGPMDALGVDVARGGRDKTVLTPRHGAWFGPQICEPGSATPDGPAVLNLIARNIQGRALVSVDVIGVGGAVVDLGRQQGLRINPVNGAAGTDEREVGGNFGFANRRAELYWRLREALDPASGQELAIPPDRELRADLTAPRWKMTPRGVQIESKDDIAKRIGRSPDKGDSLVYALAQEPRIRGWGMYELARREAEELAFGDALPPAAQGPVYAPGSVEWLAQQAAPASASQPAMVRLKVPHPCSHVHGASGRSYPVRDGIITVDPEDAAPLRRKGYQLAEES